MKKMIPWIIASAVIMLVFPWLAVTFVKGDGGMAVCFILFFALNPIYAIFAGVQASRDVKRFWALPMITAVFLCSIHCIPVVDFIIFIRYPRRRPKSSSGIFTGRDFAPLGATKALRPWNPTGKVPAPNTSDPGKPERFSLREGGALIETGRVVQERHTAPVGAKPAFLQALGTPCACCRRRSRAERPDADQIYRKIP